MTFHIMGTGSRSMRTHPDAQKIFSDLKDYIVYLRDEVVDDDIVLISGMAEGWDEAIAKAAIALSIPFIAMVPNYTYGDFYWNTGRSCLKRDRRNEFKDLINQAIEVIFVCDKNIYVDGVHSNFIRNSAMIEKADMALVYSLTSPGTRDAVTKLKQAHVTYHTYPFVTQGALFS